MSIRLGTINRRTGQEGAADVAAPAAAGTRQLWPEWKEDPDADGPAAAGAAAVEPGTAPPQAATALMRAIQKGEVAKLRSLVLGGELGSGEVAAIINTPDEVSVCVRPLSCVEFCRPRHRARPVEPLADPSPPP